MRVIKWNGEGGDRRWDNPKNWAGGRVPGADEAAVLGDHLGRIVRPAGVPRPADVHVGTGTELVADRPGEPARPAERS